MILAKKLEGHNFYENYIIFTEQWSPPQGH
jgi:hypothetical protein